MTSHADETLAKSFNCSKCGTQHLFPTYVFAHWDTMLVHTCEHCGALHHIRQGIATCAHQVPALHDVGVDHE